MLEEIPRAPTPRSTSSLLLQRREQEQASCRKEKKIRRRERREQESEECRLCEQQGLSPPAMPENSSSCEQEGEESDGGRVPP
jgi:hypothetical protein